MFLVFVQTEVRITDADLHPMFVQVALLQKGDSFVRTRLDVSLSVISDISRVARYSMHYVHEFHCALTGPIFNFCYVQLCVQLLGKNRLAHS